MNPVALAVMTGLAACFLAALLYALKAGAGWALAVLAVTGIALFVRWR